MTSMSREYLPFNAETGCESYNDLDSDYFYRPAALETKEQILQKGSYTPICKGIPVKPMEIQREVAAKEENQFKKEYLKFYAEAHTIINDVNGIQKFLNEAIDKHKDHLDAWGEEYPDSAVHFKTIAHQLATNMHTVVNDLRICMPEKEQSSYASTFANVLDKMTDDDMNQFRADLVKNGCANLDVIRENAKSTIYPLASRLQKIFATAVKWSEDNDVDIRKRNKDKMGGGLSGFWASSTSWVTDKISKYKGYLVGIIVASILMSVLSWVNDVPALQWLTQMWADRSMCGLLGNPVAAFVLAQLLCYGVDCIRASEKKGKRMKTVDAAHARIVDHYDQISYLNEISESLIKPLDNPVLQSAIVVATTYEPKPGDIPFEDADTPVSKGWDIIKVLIRIMVGMTSVYVTTQVCPDSIMSTLYKKFAFDDKGKLPFWDDLTNTGANLKSKVTGMLEYLYKGNPLGDLKDKIQEWWEWFKSFVLKTTDKLTEAAIKAEHAAKQAASATTQATKEGIDTVKSAAAGVAEQVKEGVDVVKSAAAGVAGQVKEGISSIKEAPGMLKSAAGKIEDVVSSAANTGKGIVGDISQPILNAATTVQTAEKTAEAAVKGFVAGANVASGDMPIGYMSAAGDVFTGFGTGAKKAWNWAVPAFYGTVMPGAFPPTKAEEAAALASDVAAAIQAGVSSSTEAAATVVKGVAEAIQSDVTRTKEVLATPLVQQTLEYIAGLGVISFLGSVVMVSGDVISKDLPSELRIPYKLHEYDTEEYSDIIERQHTIRPLNTMGLSKVTPPSSHIMQRSKTTMYDDDHSYPMPPVGIDLHRGSDKGYGYDTYPSNAPPVFDLSKMMEDMEFDHSHGRHPASYPYKQQPSRGTSPSPAKPIVKAKAKSITVGGKNVSKNKSSEGDSNKKKTTSKASGSSSKKTPVDQSKDKSKSKSKSKSKKQTPKPVTKSKTKSTPTSSSKSTASSSKTKTPSKSTTSSSKTKTPSKGTSKNTASSSKTKTQTKSKSKKTPSKKKTK